MRARLLKSAVLDQLRKSVATNLAIYRASAFSYLENDSSFWFEHNAEIDIEPLLSLRAPEATNLFEVENCERVHSALSALSPYDARDERLWVYLSHTILMPYARQRWPIPNDDDEATSHVLKHWFGKDKRQIERDQVGSRLWWMAHLCSRVSGLDKSLALRAFLYRSDVRANLIERPTVSQSIDLFGAIVRRLAKSLADDQRLFERRAFRSLMIGVNSVGGYRLLDCLAPTEIEALLDTIIDRHEKLDSAP